MLVCLNINCYVTVKENASMQKVTQQIGTLKVEVAGEQPKDIIQQLGFWGSLPSVCPFDVEGGPCNLSLQLTYKVVVPQSGEHKGKTLKYYGMRCASVPAHECNFGQRADDNSIFYKGADSFQIEFKARAQMESGYEDHGRQQQTRPDHASRDSFNQPDNNGGAAQQQQQAEHAGPTAAQRTLMSKLLADQGMTLAQAKTATGAALDWEAMNPGQAARFIDAVKNIKKEVAF